MLTPFDQFAKQVVAAVLDLCGRVATEHQVIVPVQAADIYFQPDPARAANAEQVGLLGRMAGSEPCLIEPFYNTPGVAEVQSCIAKQYNLHRMNIIEARRSGQRRPLLPRLWIISSGIPETVLDAYELQPMPGWPNGCYESLTAAHRLHVVAVRELDETRETLLLRLLGRGPTYSKAVRELAALPGDAWENQLAAPLVVATIRKITQNPNQKDMHEFLRESMEIYAEWKKQTRQEGLEQGRKQGLEKGLEKGRRMQVRELLEHRFGELSPEVVTRIDQATVEQLRLWGQRILTAEELTDVLAH